MSDGIRAPRETRIAVWRLMAEGYSDFAIANMTVQLPHFPADASTAAKIRRAFFALDRSYLVQAIKDEPELKKLLKDEQILRLMVRAFSRAAFETPIAQEHSVPDFIQAIEDTIDVLNTGDVRARNGRILEQIPTLYDLKDDSNIAVVQRIVGKLNRLRTMCDNGRKDGSIKQVDIGWMIAPGVAGSMEALRSDILADFEGIYPGLRTEILDLRLSDYTK